MKEYQIRKESIGKVQMKQIVNKIKEKTVYSSVYD